MTEEAAHRASASSTASAGAKRRSASTASYKGETGDDEGNKQIAQYHLAIALYRLQVLPGELRHLLRDRRQAEPPQVQRDAALARRSSRRSSPSRPTSSSASVSTPTTQIARFNNPQQRDLYWQLNYLLGRYKYRNRHYEEAISLFEKVDAQSRSTSCRRSSSPASRTSSSASRCPRSSRSSSIVTAIDEGVEGVEDEARMRDLAFLSMARTYYSASVRLDENNAPTHRRHQALRRRQVLEQGRRRAASTGSTRSSRSRGRTSWPATTRTRSATSTPSRRRTSRTRSTPRPTSSRRSSTSRTASTTTRPPIVAQVQGEVRADQEGARRRSSTASRATNQEEPFFKFLKEVRAGKANLPPRPSSRSSRTRSRIASSSATSSTSASSTRSRRASRRRPARFQNSPLGGEVQRRAAARARPRDSQRRQPGARALPAQRSTSSTSTCATARRSSSTSPLPQRNQLDQRDRDRSDHARKSRKVYGVVKPDEEHVLWPFDGEYWRDELGFYRQVVDLASAGR